LLCSLNQNEPKVESITDEVTDAFKIFSGAWGAFQSLPSEPELEFKSISDIDWCYPKVSGHHLNFYSGSRRFAASAFQVLEPVDGQIVDVNQLTGLCIPGLGFHTEGFRLGRGKGYYDKTFSAFLGTKIGICYDFCVSSEVPYESHDIKMDYIVTDLQVIHTGEN
jgi:5-formyltetrahydrofolate cyclo-ligase